MITLQWRSFKKQLIYLFDFVRENRREGSRETLNIDTQY